MPNLAVRAAVSVEKTKPLVQDYFDADAAVLEYLKMRLPHVSKATAKFVRVYLSADKTISKFRVNYWADAGDGVYPIQQIIHSVYVEVLVNKGQISIIKQLV